MAPRADAGGQSQTRRARAAADVQHALARRGRGGFDRGLAEHRRYGVEPGLVGDPALPALVIPAGDPIGIVLCHDISLFSKLSDAKARIVSSEQRGRTG